jgi:hypothetical protein
MLSEGEGGSPKPSTPEATVPEQETPKSTNPRKQPRITKFPSPIRKITEEFTIRVFLAMAIWVAIDTLPISVVEGEGFITMCSVMLGPNFKVPSRYKIMNILTQLKVQGKDWMVDTLLKIDFVNLTTDGWTSRAQHSYMTTTCHYITKGWVLASHVLYTAEFPNSHTAVNLANELEEHNLLWGLGGKILSTTHDNARNITKAVKSSTNLGESNPCFAHTQNLCVKAVLDYKPLKKLLKRCRRLVGFFKHSTKANEKLKAQQKDDDKQVKKLIQHCPTRWNSCHDMLKRLVEQRHAINTVLLDRTLLSRKRAEILLFENNDWTMIEDVIKILEPFAATLQELCADKYVTISAVRSDVYYLLTEVKPAINDSKFVKDIKRILSHEVPC